tara:strand:+ start:9399 stop:10313 length:915 start_codon:yes stop_codon:yes gene_type:complete
MLWVEKYRPQRIDQIVGQDKFVLDAKGWIKNKSMPNVLCAGRAGIGKTAAAISLGREMLGADFDSNFTEINASDDRKLETVRTTIRSIAEQGVIGDSEIRIIFLDEMDGMTRDAQFALRRVMERYTHVRFIITANHQEGIIEAIQSRVACYRFLPLEQEQIVNVLEKIMEKENISVKRYAEEIEPFVSLMGGDMRRSINELQAAVASGNSLSKQGEKSTITWNQILELLIDRKMEDARVKLCEELYKGKTVQDICVGLHDAINTSSIDTNTKFKFLHCVGEAEWRGKGMTPRVLISWLVSKMGQ